MSLEIKFAFGDVWLFGTVEKPSMSWSTFELFVVLMWKCLSRPRALIHTGSTLGNELIVWSTQPLLAEDDRWLSVQNKPGTIETLFL